MLENLNRLRPLLSRRDKLLYVALLGMMVGGALMDVIGVGAVPAFVATLAMPEKVMEYEIARRLLGSLEITSNRDLVMWGCLGLIVVFIFKNAYLTFLNYAQVRITEYHRVRMSTRLFAAYMRAPYEFHLERNSAELLRNVSTETKEIFTGIINPVLNITMGSLMALGVAALLLTTTPGVAFAGFAIVAGGSWLFLRIFRGKLRRYGREAKHERKETIKAVNQGLGAVVDARVLGRERSFIEAFRRSMAHFAHVDRMRAVIAKASTPILETISVAGLLLIVLILLLSGREAASLIPMLALFGAAIVRLKASIGQIVTGVSQIQYSMAALPNVTDDLKLLEPPRISAKRPRVAAANRDERLPFKRALRLEHITYAYPDTTRPALNDINLIVEKGSTIGIVGPTGSGKSTLINVILGLLAPQEGSMTVDNVNVFDNLSGWHRNVGYIPQTIFLLDDTIRRNIAFGVPDEEIDDEALWTAIHAAQLNDVVHGLEHGLNTVVGERGVRLSGGQRQRVGLARALYHNPDILIMDEATSALDNRTEDLVMQALDGLKGDRTIIMIAHRLSTVREADRLYYLDCGQIIAGGSYDDLSKTHREFRAMAEIA